MKRYTITSTYYIFGREDQGIPASYSCFTRRKAERKFEKVVTANARVLTGSTSRFLAGVDVELTGKNGERLNRYKGATPRYLEDLRSV